MEDRIGEELVALLPRLRRFAWGLAGSPDEGDDLVQSACVRALGRQDQYRQGTRLDSWMFRIIQTIWIDGRRSARARREEIMEAADLEPLAAGDAAAELEHRLALAGVRRHVAQLPPDQRAVLLLVSVEGLSYKAAAETLGIPVGTVMSRLSRARLALARMLGAGAGEGERLEGSWTMTTRPEQRWSEDMLMAYVDGELGPAEAAALAEVIREDPRARELVAMFRESAAAVRTAYDRPMGEPPPERLLRAAMPASAPRRRWAPQRRGGLAFALAAGVAGLAIGIGAGHLAFAPDAGGLRTAAVAPDAAPAAHEAALFRALASGEAVAFEDPAAGVRGEVVPGESLPTRLAGSCREYEVRQTGADGPASFAGIACAADGGWAVMDLPPADSR